MQQLSNLVVHCSDSLFGDAKTIDGWHKERGWKGIGYHFVILNGVRNRKEGYRLDYDGLIEPGRTLDNDLWIRENEVGAHALGFNQNSLGVCLIGGAGGKKEGFTIKQYFSLLILSNYYSLLVPKIKILGHNETGVDKLCPVINMELFQRRLIEFSFQTPLLLKKDIEKEGI